MYISFDLNPLTPFETPIQDVLRMIRGVPAFVAEIQRVTLPEPVACEGIRCYHCNTPVICTPMEFCDPCCEGPDVDAGVDDDEEAMDAYIDEVLDRDYDY